MIPCIRLYFPSGETTLLALPCAIVYLYMIFVALLQVEDEFGLPTVPRASIRG